MVSRDIGADPGHGGVLPASSSPLGAASVPPFPIARFSVAQYHRLVESGVFGEDDGVELIEGWVVRKMAKGPAHEFATGELEEILRARLRSGWHVRNQAPVTLARSEPEPDLSVVRGARGDYRARHPQAAEVALVVEVADSSLQTDRLKATTYGAARIPAYWIINLAEGCLEVFSKPSSGGDGGYDEHRRLQPTEPVELVVAGASLGQLSLSALFA